MDEVKRKTREVIEAMHLESNYPPRLIRVNTNKILSAIQTVSNYKIVPVVIPKEDMTNLRGMLLPFPLRQDFDNYIDKHPHLRDILKIDTKDESTSAAFVLISSENNECWERFTCIKEASHLYLEDCDLDNHSDVYTTAKALVDFFSFGSDTPVDNERLIREIRGIIAAIELLMPESILSWCKHQRNVEKNSTYQIAAQLMIPEKYVEWRLSKWDLL